MTPFIEWNRAPQEEDIAEFGSLVKRSDDAYYLLYEIYRKSVPSGGEENG